MADRASINPDRTLESYTELFHAGQTRLPVSGRGDANGQAIDARHAHVPVRTGDGTGSVRRVCAAEPFALFGAGAHADGHSESAAAAAAIHLVAVSGFAASERG